MRHYCWEAIETYVKFKCRFVVVARKTARLLAELDAADWKPSPNTDADAECEFSYKPEGWEQEFRFVALRYDETERPAEETPAEQYQLFANGPVTYRVFVTNFVQEPIDNALSTLAPLVTWFYRGRASNALSNSCAGGEPDQGIQQRCWIDGASLGTLRHQWRKSYKRIFDSFPIGDAGLQPELLAVADS